MERLLQRLMLIACIVSIPFLFRKPKLNVWITTFFMKGVLSSLIDTIVVKTGRVSYPTRPIPKIFKINILFDYLFFPLLSVLWVRWSYKVKPSTMILQSLCFSVPMSIGQWWFEKRGMLFKWNNWSILHTFAFVNLTLWTVRGFIGLLKKLEPKAVIRKDEAEIENEDFFAELTEEEIEKPTLYQ